MVRKNNSRKAESEKVMKDYQVSYMLGDMYHMYVLTAENEAQAILKAVNRLPDGSKERLHDFKIERYFQKWN